MQLIDYSLDGTTKPQLWNAIGYGCGTAFINAKSGFALSGPNNDGPVAEVNPVDASDSSIWTIATTAIRPLRDSTYNLNVESGDNVPQAGAGVCTWTWAGGKPNETWALVSPSSVIAPTQVEVRCKSVALVLQPNAAGTGVNVQAQIAGQSNQTWLLANQENGYCTLQHLDTGLYLVTPQSQGSVLLGAAANFTDSYLWTLATDGAIASFQHPNLNLNIQGGVLVGATVLAWPWGGGQPNEEWSMATI